MEQARPRQGQPGPAIGGPAPGGEPAPGAGQGTIIFVAALVSFLTPFMGSSVIVALPAISYDFAADAITLSWVATSFILAAAMFMLPFGRIADIYGRRRVFLYGIVVYTLASLLCALSPSILALIGFRVIQGIGSSMVAGTVVAILISVVPLAVRGRALGINVAAVYTGLSLGPFAGGILTEAAGWRSLFVVNVLLGALVIPFVFSRFKGDWAEASGESFDLAGSVIYGITLLAAMYGFSRLPDPSGAVLVAGGLVGLAAFVWWELRVEHPVFDVALFRHNSVFAFSNLAALINYSATTAVGFLLSLYLQYEKGLSPRDAGLVLMAQPVVMATLSPLAGRLSDRIEPRVVASIGMAITTAGLGLLVLLAEDTGLAFIIGGLVVLGLGFAFFSSPNTNAVMSSVERRCYGVASSILGTMRLVGQMLSLGLVVMLLAVYLGPVQITPEVYPRFMAAVKLAFGVFTVLCTGGVLASLARGKVR